MTFGYQHKSLEQITTFFVKLEAEVEPSLLLQAEEAFGGHFKQDLGNNYFQHLHLNCCKKAFPLLSDFVKVEVRPVYYSSFNFYKNFARFNPLLHNYYCQEFFLCFLQAEEVAFFSIMYELLEQFIFAMVSDRKVIH